MLATCAASVLSSAEVGRTTMTIREPLELVAEANPDNARELRVRFQQWLRRLGAPTDLVDDLTLAVYEALANVVDHAYHPGHPHPVMYLLAHLDPDQLLITITDHGCWRVPSQPGYRGRGLALMRSLTTEVDLRPTADGTTVHLRAVLHHSPKELTIAP